MRRPIQDIPDTIAYATRTAEIRGMCATREPPPRDLSMTCARLELRPDCPSSSWRLAGVLLIAGLFALGVSGTNRVVLADPSLIPDFTTSTFSGLSAEERELLIEYAHAFPRLRETYENLSIQAEIREYWAPTREQATSQLDELPRHGRARLLYDAQEGRRFRFEWIRYDRKDFDLVRGQTLGVVTPEISSLLKKDLETGKWFLKGTGKDSEEYLRFARSLNVHIAPFADLPVTLDCFLLTESHPVKTIESVTLKENNVVEAVMVVRNPEGTGRTTYELLRGAGWAVKRIRDESDMPEREAIGYYESICEYEGEIDGIPLLKTWENRGGSRNRTTGEILWRKRDIADVVCNPRPDYAPGHFDADSILGNTIPLTFSGSGSGTQWLLLINAALLFLLGIWLSRKQKKSAGDQQQ